MEETFDNKLFAAGLALGFLIGPTASLGNSLDVKRLITHGKLATKSNGKQFGCNLLGIK